MPTFNLKLPDMKGDPEQIARELQRLRDYVYMLNEQLRYQFSHIDDENISEGAVTEEALSIPLKKKVQDAAGNYSLLKQTAKGLYTDISALSGELLEIAAEADSLLVRMSTAEGDISSIESSAQSLGTRLSNAEGDITALEQSAQGFTASIQSLEDDMDAAETTLALKADQASLNQVQGNLQTQINSVPGQINLAVQNVQPGGRNLILNSYINESNSLGVYSFGRRNLSICLKPNTTYTFTVRGHKGNSNGNLRCYVYTDPWVLAYRMDITTTELSTQQITFTTPANADDYPWRFSAYNAPSGSSGQVYIEWATLMEGNKAPLDFVPAPEDPVSSLVNSTVEIGQDIHIKTGGKFTTQSQNFSIDAAGNVVMKGRVEASSGKIGGFDIGQTGIYYQKSHVGADVDGVYVGPDGIAVGKQSDAHIRLSPYGYMYGKYLEFENDTQWDNTWFALVVNKSTGRRFRVDLSISDRDTYIDASIALKSLATMMANFLSFRVNADGTNPYMVISPYTRVDGELVKDINGAAYPYLHTQNFTQHVTPAAIGALPTAGGTMTGDINFDASSAAKAVYFSGNRGVRSNPDGTLIVSASSGFLYLRPNGNAIGTGQVVISQNAITRDGYTVFDTNNFGSARAPAGTDYGTFRPRNIAFGTGAASGGGNGDVYLKYV